VLTGLEREWFLILPNAAARAKLHINPIGASQSGQYDRFDVELTLMPLLQELVPTLPRSVRG
jgi:hypothetical protein